MIDLPVTCMTQSQKQTRFGLEVLRFWAASVDFTKDVTVGFDQLLRLSEIVQKIRSTARFLLGNVHRGGLKAMTLQVSLEELGLIERYMLHVVYEFQMAVQAAYDALDFKQVVQLITKFTTSTLSGFYFEMTKDILYNDLENGSERQEVLYVLEQTLNVYKFSLAPILPHMAEEIFVHQLGQSDHQGSEVRGHSAFEELLPALDPTWKDDLVFQRAETLILIRNGLLRELEVLRQEKRVKTSAETELIIDLSSACGGTGSGLEFLRDHGHILSRFFGLSDVTLCWSADSISTLFESTTPEWRHELRLGLNHNVSSTQMFLVPARRLKCPRCWKFTVEKGHDLCERCTNVLNFKA